MAGDPDASGRAGRGPRAAPLAGRPGSWPRAAWHAVGCRSALCPLLAAAASAALVLHHALEGDMQWYGWFAIAAGAASLLLAAAVLSDGPCEKRREQRHRRGRMRESIREAEGVFRRMSSLSKDYDFVDEGEATERIAAYARGSAERLGRCRSEIEAHIRHMGGSDAAIRDAGGAVDALLWFDRFYGCRGAGPSVAQRVAWNDDRRQIDRRLDVLSRASRILAGP